MTKIGSNTFKDCNIPIVFENRYFVLEQANGQDIFSVFILIKDEPIFEIFRNDPIINSITEVSKSSAGFITVSEKGGGFIYKIRPKYNGSSIFGKIEGKDVEIKITDRQLSIGTNTFQNNKISGFGVGIHISQDGSITIGSSLPEKVMHLFKKK